MENNSQETSEKSFADTHAEKNNTKNKIEKAVNKKRQSLSSDEKPVKKMCRPQQQKSNMNLQEELADASEKLSDCNIYLFQTYFI